LVRLVIERTIIVIVPLITSFLLNVLMLLVPAVNSIACISAADEVAQISIIPIPPSAAFLRWSEIDGRVPVRTLSMVKLVTTYSTVTVVDWVHHSCYIQHRLEAFTCALTSSLSLGKWGMSWLMSILEARELWADVR
jgi:hypothetical protein